MNALDRLVRTNGYKNFMAKLYGWGAAVVIVGALFKILHWPGANIMLMVGMFTEAVIFFLSAFEPPHVEFNWALVYPELAIGQDEETVEPTKRERKKAVQGASATQQLDKMLEDAKIGPELIESLATGMRNLSENANKLAGVSDAAVATDSYVGNLTKAAESVRNLSLKYDKVAASLETDANASTAYIDGLKKATNAINQMAAAYEQTTTYKAEMDKLTNNIAALSKVYGNMLAAMGVNTNK
ncbi:MAG: gliding motility protein GldL [Bacteroidales bacterium]|nr:gliding motility protein GldL [Bacteroidales bacterium]